MSECFAHGFTSAAYVPLNAKSSTVENFRSPLAKPHRHKYCLNYFENTRPGVNIQKGGNTLAICRSHDTTFYLPSF